MTLNAFAKSLENAERIVRNVGNTALSVQHWTAKSDTFTIIQFAACLLQEPVTDAAMDFRQGHAPAVGPRGKKPRGGAPAG